MKRWVPRARSTTIPNITREYILNRMCQKPSCMNMWVMGCHQRKSVLRGKAIAKVSFMNEGLMRVATNIRMFTYNRLRVTTGMFCSGLLVMVQNLFSSSSAGTMDRILRPEAVNSGFSLCRRASSRR